MPFQGVETQIASGQGEQHDEGCLEGCPFRALKPDEDRVRSARGSRLSRGMPFQGVETESSRLNSFRYRLRLSRGMPFQGVETLICYLQAALLQRAVSRDALSGR